MAASVNRLSLVLIIVLLVVADQWTKDLAREHLPLNPKTYAGGLLQLTLTENSGAFLSLGDNLPRPVRTAIFSIGVLIAVGVALFLVLMNRIHGLDAVAVALIAGGGIGNLIDRIFRGGSVTDFLFMKIGPLHTGIFNVADIAITAGVIWLFVSSFIPGKKAES